MEGSGEYYDCLNEEITDPRLEQLFQTLPNVIGYILDSKVKEGDSLEKKAKNPNTYFWQKTAPSIGIKEYLAHLIKCFKSPPAVLILCMIYVERFLQNLSTAMHASGSAYPYLLTSKNVHKIVLMAFLISHKYSLDIKYPFSIVSKISGVSEIEVSIKVLKIYLCLSCEEFVNLYHTA